MKTVEGIEIPLGKITLMPIKHIDKYEFNLNEMADRGHMFLDNVKTSQPPPHVNPFSPLNEFLRKPMLEKLKPANYHD